MAQMINAPRTMYRPTSFISDQQRFSKRIELTQNVNSFVPATFAVIMYHLISPLSQDKASHDFFVQEKLAAIAKYIILTPHLQMKHIDPINSINDNSNGNIYELMNRPHINGKFNPFGTNQNKQSLIKAQGINLLAPKPKTSSSVRFSIQIDLEKQESKSFVQDLISNLENKHIKPYKLVYSINDNKTPGLKKLFVKYAIKKLNKSSKHLASLSGQTILGYSSIRYETNVKDTSINLINGIPIDQEKAKVEFQMKVYAVLNTRNIRNKKPFGQRKQMKKKQNTNNRMTFGKRNLKVRQGSNWNKLF